VTARSIRRRRLARSLEVAHLALQAIGLRELLPMVASMVSSTREVVNTPYIQEAPRE